MKTKLAFISLFVLIAFLLQAQSASKTELRFGLMTDIQYCSSPASGTRYYQSSLLKARQIVMDLNKEKADFTIHLGDLIDRDVASYDSILPIVHKLNKPIFFAYGNHDYNVSEKYKSVIDSIHGQSRSYYSFHKKGWRCVILNTNEMSVYAYPAGSPQKLHADSLLKTLKSNGSINAQPWNGGVGSDQLKWLEMELKSAQKAHQQVLVFGHHPIYPAGSENALNDVSIVQLLERYSCVKAYFCGHKHEGGFAQKGDIAFFNLKGVVETPVSISYGIVVLTSDSLSLIGKGRETSKVLHLKK